MAQRLMGVETEYALCAVTGQRPSPVHEPAVRGLMGLVQRRCPYLRGAHSGGCFLANGARFYIDTGAHPEWATPEVPDPWEAVRYVKAGAAVLAQAARELDQQYRPHGRVKLLTHHVDYLTTATWGCHESYMYRGRLDGVPRQLIPHLVSRIVYSGAGGFNPVASGVQFTLSPRVWRLAKAVSSNSTSDRGIFHTKDEPLGSGGYHRVHVLSGESNCSELSAWLKLGTTAIVLALIEAGLNPSEGVQLAEPLQAMRKFAADPSCRAKAAVAAASSAGGRQRLAALDIQRHYLELAERHADREPMPPWTAQLCSSWRRVLDRLADGPDTVCTCLDWAIKHTLYRHFAAEHKAPWPAGTTASRSARLLQIRPKLLELDLRYGQLHPPGLFDHLDQTGTLGHHVPGIDNIEAAIEQPPATGRAHIRGNCIRRLANHNDGCSSEWNAVYNTRTGEWLDLGDPFCSKELWRKLESPHASQESVRLRWREMLFWAAQERAH